MKYLEEHANLGTANRVTVVVYLVAGWDKKGISGRFWRFLDVWFQRKMCLKSAVKKKSEIN
jgi:hypothetical protein